MNGEAGNGQMVDELDDDIDDVEEDDDLELIGDDDEESDNIGDLSVEINVDELVAKIEGRDSDEARRRREIRRRLEEIREQREAERELDNTFNFNLDDEL